MTDALAALRAEITAGWTVDIIDHDYLADSREDARVERVTDDGLIIRPRRPWSSQGRSFPFTSFTWDKDGEADGHTVHLYHTPPPHTGKSRRLIKTYRFRPPTH